MIYPRIKRPRKRHKYYTLQLVDTIRTGNKVIYNLSHKF